MAHYGVIGLALLPLAALILWRRGGLDARANPWLGLALFSLASMALTTAGRAALGREQALASRYQIFSTLWWVALLVIIALVVQRGRTPDAARTGAARPPRARVLLALNALALLLLGAGLVRANIAGLREADDWLVNLQRNEQCVRQYDAAPDDCLTLFYPVAGIVRIHAAFLEQHRLSTFREAPTTPDFAQPPRAGAAPAAIDRIAGAPVATDGHIAAPAGEIVVQGWAFDASAGTAASAVYLLIDGRYTYRSGYGELRPDVAAATGLPGAREVGFTATLPPGMLAPGVHTLAVRIITADGRAYADSPPLATLTITPEEP